MKAVRVHKPGGPEGMVYEDVPDPQAGSGQVVVKVEAIGLNFAEVNRRRNAPMKSNRASESSRPFPPRR